MSGQPNPRVGLFVTCLVDAIRPSIGFSAIQLLEEAGCRVEVPQAQTCCGQPALNSGDEKDAAALARQTIAAFEGFDYIVLPSGSCAGTIVHGYPDLLANDPVWAPRAEAMAAKTHEITSFLVDVMGFHTKGRRLEATATYHDSCAGLRELGIAAQPRALLAEVEGLQMRGLEGNDVCCGFGGSYSVKFPEISAQLLEKKVNNMKATGADRLVVDCPGCVMQLRGGAEKQGLKIKVDHISELLADNLKK